MKRILVLGGTAWLGKEIAHQFIAQGNQVTCLARGEAGTAPSGARFICADRTSPGAYNEVSSQEWDEVIELSYDPQLVQDALTALGTKTQHWTLISSVSVYAQNNEPDADEFAALAEPTDPTNYAHAKVTAEQLTTQAVGERLLILRPGLIVGPGDPSDRFSYWVCRLAQAGDEDVLVPETESRFAQFIDVRDLARYVLVASTNNLCGVYNAVGSQFKLSTVIAAAALVAGFTGKLVSADDAWLRAHDVAFWAGPRALPLWLPLEDAAFAQRSAQRYFISGGVERSLIETLESLLADERTRGLDRIRRSGLSRTDELELLSKLAAGN